VAQFVRDRQFWKFAGYGFLKNLRFFDPYLILIFRETGLSYLQIGLLFSVREIATNLLEMPSGVAADLYGRRKAMMIAFGAYILSFLLFYLFPGFYPYLGAMLLFSVGEAFRSGTHKAMILDYLQRNNMAHLKVHYYGATRSWSQRGSALSALIAGGLVFLGGSYRIVFLYTMIPYIAGIFLMGSYPRYLDFSAESGRETEGEATEEGEGARRRLTQPFSRRELRSLMGDFRRLLSSAASRRALLNSALYDALFKTAKDYIQPVMKRIALSAPLLLFLARQERVAVMTALLYFLLYLFTAYLTARSGRLSERLGPVHRGLNLSYLLSVLLMLGVGATVWLQLPELAVLLFIGFYGFQNLRRPLTVAFVSERIEGKVMATGLSAESQLKTFLVAILAPLFGMSADRFGLPAAFALLALLALLLYPLLHLRRE
jgi:MFS family permease